jgi:hypothetical protein
MLLKDYCFTVERWFVRPNDLDSYAGASMSSWYSNPCQTGQRVWATQNVVPGPPDWGLGVGLMTPPHKIYCYETLEEDKTHRYAAPQK